MSEQRTERGQGLLEMAVILPVLLILMLGVVEVGYALRSYLIVVNANREGCRYAARGRFDDTSIFERVVVAGGMDYSVGDHFLRTDMVGPDPNTGIIITHIPMSSTGEVAAYTVRVSGVIPSEAGEIQPIVAESSMISSPRWTFRSNVCPALVELTALVRS